MLTFIPAPAPSPNAAGVRLVGHWEKDGRELCAVKLCAGRYFVTGELVKELGGDYFGERIEGGTDNEAIIDGWKFIIRLIGKRRDNDGRLIGEFQELFGDNIIGLRGLPLPHAKGTPPNPPGVIDPAPGTGNFLTGCSQAIPRADYRKGDKSELLGKPGCRRCMGTLPIDATMCEFCARELLTPAEFARIAEPKQPGDRGVLNREVKGVPEFVGEDAARLNRSAAIHARPDRRQTPGELVFYCCDRCRGNRPRMTMLLCPICGNKRCPKAEWHDYRCTGSNATGQVGVLENSAPVPIPGPGPMSDFDASDLTANAEDEPEPDDATQELPTEEILLASIAAHEAALEPMEEISDEFAAPKCPECGGSGSIPITIGSGLGLVVCNDCDPPGSGLAPPAPHQPVPRKSQAEKEIADATSRHFATQGRKAKAAKRAKRK